ncbi:MAG: response regulator, partial [Poseidonibacter sp.]
MLNKEFLKTLTILYVENDENIITSFEPFLNNLFKKVFISNNGKDALTKYNDLINNKEQIDIIISESTMPYMSGIELLSKIRESNKNLPFIFFTEDNDINLLLESLKQDVTAHFTKPVKFEEVLQKVEEVCLVKKEEDKVLHSQAEVEEYLEIINKVAVVFIFDENGKINYVNEFLKELVGCEDDDIIGEDYKIIYHHEIAKEILKNQEETLLNGQNWQGKLKYITRNSSTFYANSTIFPI